MPIPFKVVPAVHVLLVRDDRVLLSRRSNTGYEDGKWSVPAGHVDGDEPVRAAAVREAMEELRISIEADDLAFGHVMHRREPHEERVDFFFVAREWSGEPMIAEPDKCSEPTWAHPSRLPESVIPYVVSGLQAALAGRRYSEFGW